MQTLKEYYIKDIATIKSGKRLPKGHSLVDFTTKYPYIKGRDIRNGKIRQDQLQYLTEDTQKKIKRYIVETNDVCITIVANIGDVGIVPSSLNGVNLTENAIRLTKIKNFVSPQFLCQLLSAKFFKEHMELLAAGAAQSKLGIYKIEKIKVLLPPLSTQQRIASILSAYDDLIEVNNQRIKLLEETARELYKEWFVRMRFPGYKKSKFVKGVPEGWEVKKIGDVCKVARGSSPRPIVDTRYFENGTIPWVKIADASASGKFLFETKEYVNEFGASFSRLLKAGSLIIATSGTLGFCIFLAIEACIHDGWMYTTDYKFCVTPEFLFFIINDRTEYFNNLSYGAAIQNINTDILRKAPFLLPNKDLLEKFQGMIVPINKHQKILQQQNTQLRQIRDRLLPRLISGKLEVKKK